MQMLLERLPLGGVECLGWLDWVGSPTGRRNSLIFTCARVIRHITLSPREQNVESATSPLLLPFAPTEQTYISGEAERSPLVTGFQLC
ncbi:hypothetical protein EV294_10325 [Paenibacillus sp. BK033]|nr:hypothetical protein EV294_10325 [Paenibacillus sp. BK033]